MPYPDLDIVVNPANPTASNTLELAETFGSVLRCFVENPAMDGYLYIFCIKRYLFIDKLVSKWSLIDTECNLDT